MTRDALRLTGYFPMIPEKSLHIDEVLSSPYFYEQQLIRIVDDEIGDYIASSFGEVVHNVDKTIKIEGIEKLSPLMRLHCQCVAQLMEHNGPITCHLFIAKENSPSFPVHTDPDHVIIHVVSGTKVMEVKGREYVLSAGDSLFIPHGTPHRALNRHASTMLSFGLERYLLEKKEL